MNDMRPTNDAPQAAVSTPPVHAKPTETYGYKGWLISDSFLKRAFAVYGYNLVAGLIIMIPIMIVMAIIAGFVAATIAGAVLGGVKDGVRTGDVSTVSQKIDISAACESSLAYTTFPDSASADAYLVECREGKHPDVVQRYLESLQVPEGAAI